MFELLGSGIFGTLFGGLFRLVPEALKFFDKKNERSHELAMFRERLALERMKGDIKLEEIGASHAMAVDTGVLSAFVESIKQQGEMAKAAGGWVAALSASVRPIMTYYLLALYGAVKVAFYIDMTTGPEAVAWSAALITLWTNQDMALLCGVVNFWILDRTLSKRGL